MAVLPPSSTHSESLLRTATMKLCPAFRRVVRIALTRLHMQVLAESVGECDLGPSFCRVSMHLASLFWEEQSYPSQASNFLLSYGQ
jgi:hypothetical protein